MNLALSTIFIIVLILPGILFRFAYLKGPHSKQNFKPSTIDEIIWAIVPSIFLHMLGYFFIDFFTRYKVNFKILFTLMASEFDKLNFEIIDSSIYPFLFYLSGIMLISFVAGLLLRRTVISLRLDYKFNFFRINNDWYYILTNNSQGEKINSGIQQDTDLAEFIQVDVLVKGDRDFYIIYSGILHDFFLSKDEGLDKICLVEVYRRRFSDDWQQNNEEVPAYADQKLGESYYSMPGDLFVIPYSHILNLNVSYYTFALNETNSEKESETVSQI